MPSKNVNSFLTVNSLNLSTASILAIVGGELKRFTGQTIVIDSTGNVGIGVTPTATLDVNGNLQLRGSGSEGGQIDILNTGNLSTGLVIDVAAADIGRVFSSRNNSTLMLGQLVGTGGIITLHTEATQRLLIDSTGGVTIAGLAGSGSRAVNASAAGLLSAASDASLKEEVVGAHIAGLNEILQIHPKMYRWKDDIANRGDEASVELGFIANDVAQIIPSAAPMGNDGLYGFYDRSIIAALVKAVQELKVEIDILKNK
jgi:hypothetical protein